MKMMKRVLCILAALLLLTLSAAAEPDYPDRSGVATDDASVLSVSLLVDLREMDDRLSEVNAPRLHIATVDFLDAAEADSYAEALFTRWELQDNDVLLLMAVVEDAWAIRTGKGVDALIPAGTIPGILSECETLFQEQRYDAAIARFSAALVNEINRQCGTSVKTSDLFQRISDAPFTNWARSATLVEAAATPQEQEESILVPILKVVVVVALLFLVFGVFNRMRKAKQPPQSSPAPAPAQPTEPRVYFKPREQKPIKQYFPPPKSKE